jgi:hypothetical protein
MIKVGSIVQSKYRMGRRAKPGKLGLVLELRNTEEEAFGLARVLYPKTGKQGWVVVKDMKVVS